MIDSDRESQYHYLRKDSVEKVRIADSGLGKAYFVAASPLVPLIPTAMKIPQLQATRHFPREGIVAPEVVALPRKVLKFPVVPAGTSQIAVPGARDYMFHSGSIGSR